MGGDERSRRWCWRTTTWSEVSDGLGRLQRLRMLDLGHNRLTRVPDAIGDLIGLDRFLYLHDNQLSSLPDRLAQLTKLRYLNISGNAFTSWPDVLSSLTGCSSCALDDNTLEHVPGSIVALTRLRELHLRNNRLSSLPAEIGALEELRHPRSPRQSAHLTARDARIAAAARQDRPALDEPVESTWLDDLEARGCLVYR